MAAEVNLGVIGRADSRGLAIQTEEVARHMAPAKVLVLDLGKRSPYRFRPERWADVAPDVEVLDLVTDGHLDEPTMARFLDGLDVVYTAETPYNFALFDSARSRGIRTVLHVNYEFHRYRREPALPRPDVFAMPTTWHLRDVPGAVHLPMPVAADRMAPRRVERIDTWLHVAGHKAMHDRNGTAVVVNAIPLLRTPQRVLVRAQGTRRIGPAYRNNRVQFDVEQGDVIEDYWRVYDGADGVLLPRRYGGLSLPMAEATALGLPVVATSVAPQSAWLPPAGLIPPRSDRPVRIGTQMLRRYDCHPEDLAAMMDHLVSNPETVALMSKQAAEWAEANSWEALRPVWDAVLGA